MLCVNKGYFLRRVSWNKLWNGFQENNLSYAVLKNLLPPEFQVHFEEK